MDSVKSGLLGWIVEQFMDEPTFNQLRTIEQLGYIVFTMDCKVRDILGTAFCVQSSKKGCSHIK